jgi:uncharacterized protein YmfQ (DUF2313 family)
MSVQNFFPEIWAAGILKERDKAFIAAKHCTTEYEGQIKSHGDRVKILTVAPVSSYAYTRNSAINAPEQLNDADLYLDIDQAKYINIGIDDVDQVQANENLMTEAKRQIGLKMADDVDQDIFGLYAQAGLTIVKTAITSANILGVLAEAAKAMQEANVPDGMTKYLEVSPDVYQKMVIAKITKDYGNSDTLQTGMVAKQYGFEIYVSNNVVKSGANRSYCLIRTKQAIAYASQITKTEAYRPPLAFQDAVKALQVWGRKVIRPKELICLDITTAAES